MRLCGSLNILWHCLSLELEWKLTFSSPAATAEFSKFAGILNAALSQHTISMLYCAIFGWNVPLVSLSFLKRSLVFTILLFSSISLHWSLRLSYPSLLTQPYQQLIRRVSVHWSRPLWTLTVKGLSSPSWGHTILQSLARSDTICWQSNNAVLFYFTQNCLQDSIQHQCTEKLNFWHQYICFLKSLVNIHFFFTPEL